MSEIGAWQLVQALQIPSRRQQALQIPSRRQLSREDTHDEVNKEYRPSRPRKEE